MFDALFLPPAAEHLPILGTLTVLLLLFHLSWLGTLLVSSGLSLAFRKNDALLAGRLMDLAASNPASWWIFGVLPPLGLLFLSGQFFYGTPAAMPMRYAAVLALMFPAFLLLYFYRRSRDARLGGPGHLLLLASCYFLVGTLDLGFFPERFFFEPSYPPLLFSIQQVVHFLLFLALSALLTGAALLFFYFRWEERKLSGTEGELKFLRALGAAAALAGALGVPLMVVGELYNLPLPAASGAAFASALAMVAAGWLAAQLSFYMLKNGHARFASCVFGLALLLFGLFAFHLVRLESQAGGEHLLALAQDADAARQKITSEREALMAKNMVPDAALGEKIYTQKCTACHAFDHKVVGPAYDDVVPKYKEDPDALKSFIRNPVKKNPDFPAMPGQGLSEMEVQSVAQYLLDHAGSK